MTFQPARLTDVIAPIDVAFNPDGSRMATALPEGEVDEWELAGGQQRLLRTWQTSPYGFTFNGHSVAFTPDGTRIAATTDTGVQTWWADTSEPDLSVLGHPLQVLNMTLRADGTRLATASLDRTAKVWDARSGRELLSLAGHQAAIDHVAFSPDGQRLATASRDGTARVWNVGPSREPLTLVTGTVGHNVLREDGPQAGQVVLSHDGNRIVAGLDDGSASVWDAHTGVEALSLSGNQGKVWAAAISRDGSRLATGGSSGTVRVWDAATGVALWTGTAQREAVVAVAFSPDGTQLAAASADGTAQLWNSTTGQIMHTFNGHTGPLTSVAFSPDGTRLATGSQASGDPIRVWDVRTGEVVNTLAGHQDAVWSAAFSPDGTRLVSASRDGTARIWDLSRDASTLTLYGRRTLVDATFSPDGQRVATGNRDGLVQLWDSGTGREVLDLTGTAAGEGIDSLTFSSDGRYLAVRGDQAVRLYLMPIEDLTALVRSRLSRWWTLEECRRFLTLEGCPPGPLQAKDSSPATTGGGFVGSARRVTGDDSAQVPNQRQVNRPGGTPPILATGLTASSSIKIVSSLPHGGIGKERTDSIVNAFKMAVSEHDNRVGGTSISYVDVDDAASTGNVDASSEIAYANMAVNDPAVMVYLGPLFSGAARQVIPILCKANVAMISFSNTYPGLKRQNLFSAPASNAAANNFFSPRTIRRRNPKKRQPRQRRAFAG